MNRYKFKDGRVDYSYGKGTVKAFLDNKLITEVDDDTLRKYVFSRWALLDCASYIKKKNIEMTDSDFEKFVDRHTDSLKIALTLAYDSISDDLPETLIDDQPEEEKLLFEAIKANDVEKVMFLLKEGVDVNAGNDKQWTPIMQASQQEYASTEIVNFLIEHGADLTLKDGYGRSILALFCEVSANTDVIKLLIQKGLDVNDVSSGDHTVLMVASERNQNLEVIKTLVESGADLFAKNYEGKTAYDLAVENYEEFKHDNQMWPHSCNYLSPDICLYLKSKMEEKAKS